MFIRRRVVGYAGGRLAHLACGVRTQLRNAAWVYGSEGMIHVPEPFWCGTRAILHPGEKTEVVFEQSHRANGYEYEAEEVGRCLRVGLKRGDPGSRRGQLHRPAIPDGVERWRDHA